MNVRKAGLLTLLLVLGLGTAFFFFRRGETTTRPTVISAQEKEERKREILGIASIEDENRRAAELRSYVGRNPGGPFLGIAYNLLLDSLYSSDKVAAMDLADRILERYTKPDEIEIRVPAYRMRLTVLSNANRQSEATSLARTLLANESDPDLLRFASQFDPANRQSFDKKIAEVVERDRVRAIRQRLSELLGLPIGDWEAKTMEERTRYLEGLLESAAEASASDPKSADRVRNLLRLLVEHLNGAGNGAAALTYLDRYSSWAREEDWYFAARGKAAEGTGDPDAALDNYLLAFAQAQRKETWRTIRRLADTTGSGLPVAVRRTEEAMAKRNGARGFPPFNLRTPDGRPLGLADLSTRAVLVTFFFPG